MTPTDPLDIERTPPWHSVAATPAAPGRSGTGRVVGRYRLERVLGEGTYGTVHLARHEVLGRRVAVKVLHRRHGSGREEIRAFLHEALILADLDHPAIVPVYDAGWTEDGLYYIVSKYVEGCDLGRAIRAAAAGPHGRRRVSSSRSPGRCTTPTPGVWSTGTSSPPTY